MMDEEEERVESLDYSSTSRRAACSTSTSPSALQALISSNHLLKLH